MNSICHYGKLWLKFLFGLIVRFPNITAGVLMASFMTLVIAAVPFIGPPLAAFLGPFLLLFGVIVGASRDWINPR